VFKVSCGARPKKDRKKAERNQGAANIQFAEEKRPPFPQSKVTTKVTIGEQRACQPLAEQQLDYRG